jgi:HD-GYP domain-containing protein (c-di-GMP phosphodiesterase class II)
MAGRIVCAADAYDALRNERPYKRASSQPEALAEIRAWRGRQFDPRVADALESYLASRSIADPASALAAT